MTNTTNRITRRGPIRGRAGRMAVVAASAVLGAGLAAGFSPGEAGAHGNQPGSGGFTVSQVLSGKSLTHTFTTASGQKSEPLSDPDDVTWMDGSLFVVFQNGVGPQGQPSSSGNVDSTVVEFTPAGQVLGQWDVTGKTDGVVADPAHHRIIATVNEDANSSLYTIVLSGGSSHGGGVAHYRYSQNPLPHNGGTDALSIVGGQILVSASAPGTPSTANESPSPAPTPAYPAVYSIALDPFDLVATIRPVFYDESSALAANGSHAGTTVTLGLTDPDSNEVVPGSSPRFARDFVLDSQGDEEQIYVHDPGRQDQSLTVLSLSQSIDDTAWATSPVGTLYASDPTTDEVVAVNGSFTVGTAYVAATPCDADSATSTCSTPNYLAELDMSSGQVTPVATSGLSIQPQGMIFIGRGAEGEGHGQDHDRGR